jgi:hypothetical protein
MPQPLRFGLDRVQSVLEIATESAEAEREHGRTRTMVSRLVKNVEGE